MGAAGLAGCAGTVHLDDPALQPSLPVPAACDRDMNGVMENIYPCVRKLMSDAVALGKAARDPKGDLYFYLEWGLLSPRTDAAAKTAWKDIGEHCIDEQERAEALYDSGAPENQEAGVQGALGNLQICFLNVREVMKNLGDGPDAKSARLLGDAAGRAIDGFYAKDPEGPETPPVIDPLLQYEP